MTHPQPPDRPVGSSLRPYLWTLGVLWAAPAALAVAAFLLSSDEVPEGRCSGIGFGCTLSAADTVLFVSAVAFPLLLAAGLVAICVIAVVQSRQSRRR